VRPELAPQPERRRSRLARLALALVPLLVVAGVGAAIALFVVGGSDDDGDSSQPADSPTTTTDEAAAEARASYAKCKRQIGPLLDRLHELDSRLDVGLNYDEYTTQVGDVRVEYDTAVDGIDDPLCLTAAGIPAETALNQYAKAANRWGECFDDLDCDTDTVEPTLRKYWDRASRAIETADEGLESLKAGS
jgi:hypothetical protein